MTQTSPRKPAVAVLLGLLVPGLGQLYAGRPGRAAVAFCGSVGLAVFALSLGVPRSFSALVAVLVALLGTVVAVLVDAARQSRIAGPYELRWYNRWYVYLVPMVLAAVIGLPAVSPILETRVFRIASSNMEPTLLVGDRVVADMQAFVSRGPTRNELVVYGSPDKPGALLIVRVVALSGDVVEIRDKKLLLNGRELEEPWVQHKDPRTFSAGPLAPEMGVRRDQMAARTVPEGTFFVLGDNRDLSYDSRFIGAIPLSSAKGNLLYLYWSGTLSRVGRALR